MSRDFLIMEHDHKAGNILWHSYLLSPILGERYKGKSKTEDLGAKHF